MHLSILNNLVCKYRKISATFKRGGLGDIGHRWLGPRFGLSVAGALQFAYALLNDKKSSSKIGSRTNCESNGTNQSIHLEICAEISQTKNKCLTLKFR